MSLTTFGDLLDGAEARADRAWPRGVASRRLGWSPAGNYSPAAQSMRSRPRPATGTPRWYAVDRLAIQVARPMPIGLRGKATAVQ